MIVKFYEIEITIAICSYIVTYIVSIFNLFIIIFLMSNKGTFNTFKNLKIFNFFSTSCFISLLSLAGIPPFGGFFIKFFLLTILLKTNYWLVFTVFLLFILILLYFYIKNIKFLFINKLNNQIKTVNIFNITIKKNILFIFYISCNIFLLFSFIFFNDFFLNIFFFFIL